MNIKQKFEKMKSIGAFSARCLRELEENVIRPGTSTGDIDQFVWEYAYKHRLGIPQAGYTFAGASRPFPGACCTSINEEVCHGIPSNDRILKDGDLLKVDVTFSDKDSWHGDTCRTFYVGDKDCITNEKKILIQTAFQAMNIPIYCLHRHLDKPISFIGKLIDNMIIGSNYSIIKEYCGHFIGQQFHLPPCIPHYYEPRIEESHYIFQPGDTFTIEPIISAGSPETLLTEDGWCVKTKDNSLTAQFEHTIGLDENGSVVVFTEER